MKWRVKEKDRREIVRFKVDLMAKIRVFEKS